MRELQDRIDSQWKGRNSIILLNCALSVDNWGVALHRELLSATRMYVYMW